MIRYIDLTGQILLDDTPSFAFFNTVTDTFISFDGECVFHNVSDFNNSFQGTEDFYLRLHGLMPSDES